MQANTHPPESAEELWALLVEVLRRRLPRTWGVATEAKPEALLELTAPDGRRASLAVEVRRTLGLRDMAGVADRLEVSTGGGNADGYVVVARYLSPSVRKMLVERGIDYVDATGNVRLAIDDPPLFIVDRGADKDPWRGPGRRRDTLHGEPAARVVRALVDHVGPWRIRQLIDRSGASTGSVYRVVDLLTDEGLVARAAGGAISVLDWPRLLRRWAQDYQFQRTNTVSRWIAPRGITDCLERLRSAGGVSYAVTGSVAAGAWEAYAPSRSLWVYTSQLDDLTAATGLRQAEAGVNVLVAQPRYAVLSERSQEVLDGLKVAAPAQVVVDLMSGPGRAPSEAEELMTWMENNERSWRIG